MQPRDYFDLIQSTRDDILDTLTESERGDVVNISDLGRPTKTWKRRWRDKLLLKQS
jgi:hypothetical protein